MINFRLLDGIGNNMNATTIINVEYKSADNWHVFSSRDLPGLYVGSDDAEKAYNDVATAIRKLLRLNEGLECEVVSQLSFSEFLKSFRGVEPVRTLSNRTFAVAACEPAAACG